VIARSVRPSRRVTLNKSNEFSRLKKSRCSPRTVPNEHNKPIVADDNRWRLGPGDSHHS
jgi:hypothetical protein